MPTWGIEHGSDSFGSRSTIELVASDNLKPRNVGEAAIPGNDIVMYEDRPELHVASGFNTLRPRHKMILEPIYQDINREL
jgi:hypothetical protein